MIFFIIFFVQINGWELDVIKKSLNVIIIIATDYLSMKSSFRFILK